MPKKSAADDSAASPANPTRNKVRRAGARTTIDDVARAAGVSKATVSRFLNHRDTLLTPDIAERVRKAVADLSYVPSPMAQSLKRGRSRLIGLVVADITNPFSVAVLRGTEKACQEAGYLVVLFNLGNESGREREAIEALAAYQVEGFILNRVGDDAAAMAEAARHARPMVLVDRRNDAVPADFVSVDNVAATRLIATHLRDKGYRELLLVTEPLDGVSSRLERWAALQSIAAEFGLAASLFEDAGDDPATLEAALLRLRTASRAGPPAVIGGNAVITLRVAKAVAALGWQFGRELGFAGFDETEWTALVGPGLTTIEQPTDALGRAAALCLFERIGGATLPPRELLLPGRLVVRGSSLLRH